MKVLVTGSRGMLGSNIVSNLSKDEDIIVFAATSRLVQAETAAISESHTISINNDQAIDLLRENAIDLLINCAFPRDDDGAALAKGLEFASALFASAKYSCSIINISSQSVYSQKKDAPAREDDPVCPQSSYGVAKYASELMLKTLCTCPQYTNIRLASLLAPDFDARFVNKMVNHGLLQGKIRMAGPDNIFGFMSVKDAADAVCRMVPTAKRAYWHSVYNLGPAEKGISLKRIGTEIHSQLIRRGHSCALEDCVEGKYEVNSSLDSEKFYRDFEWSPKQTIRDIISEIIARVDVRGDEQE